MRKIAIVLAALVLNACGGNGKKEDQRAYPNEVPATAEYVIGFGETLHVEGGLALEFTSLTEDSRCPMNAMCIWAGNARILMTATLKDDSIQVIELNTNPDFPTRAQLDMSYVVELRKLEPYPVIDPQTGSGPIPASSYEATVFVDRVMTHQATQGP